MKSKREKCVQVEAGKIIALGTDAEFNQVSREITGYTGGSSLGGEMSMLWGLLDGSRDCPFDP
jgi:hypothetical protein